MNAKRVPHDEVGNGIDVPADSAGAELERFSDRCPAAHEWVEDHDVGNPGGLVEEALNVRPLRRESSEQDRPKHRAESLGPPFVDVVDGSMDLFPPALELGYVSELLEGKGGILYCSHPTAPGQGDRVVGKAEAFGQEQLTPAVIPSSACRRHRLSRPPQGLVQPYAWIVPQPECPTRSGRSLGGYITPDSWLSCSRHGRARRGRARRRLP